MADVVMPDLELMKRIEHPQRKLRYCGIHHNNFGNTCRHRAWLYATGMWTWFVDDDNYIASPEVLASLKPILEKLPDHIMFAIFPIHRHGWYFFNDPPGLCMTDTLNFLVRTEIGQWPDIQAREADGHFIEDLKAKYEYASFPGFPAIGVMEYSSNGV